MYWIEGRKSWVAIAEFNVWENKNISPWSKNHFNPWSECHHGPYRVEGVLEEKLLEVYNLDKKSVKGRDVSKISPSELEELAIK
jgi:hypothetical protein